MGSRAEHQVADIIPPRRGSVWAVAVDSTARAYDMTALNLAGVAPEAAGTRPMDVFLYLQAETNDVYFYFDSVTGSALDNTAAQAASAAAVAYANTYAVVLKAGNPPLRVRINRSIDKFIQVKAAAAAGVLRMWASSNSE